MTLNTRIPLLSAIRVSNSYTEQIGCIWSVGTRTYSVLRTHVRILFCLPI